MRAGKRSKPPKQMDPECSMLACVNSCSFSYYISSRGEHPRTSDDEAIIGLVAEILETTPRMPAYIGKELECSLISAVRYGRSEPNAAPAPPTLYSVVLKKDSRSLLAYLPVEVFWGLLPECRSGKLKYFEASFRNRRYGFAELVSLHFSETRPTDE
jgi:hypothetical protein